ncbi:glycosyltransferase 25 family member-like [Condylostylus longicornis]|uniref:glycosyltransferase 25 family member-like n=1 Tax=Condylostylus longicornis TaxID=2530218 RepID=UPI00244DD885|nr:glycosyltransferase 25 family member-like [Condylostylus longicornis]
MLTIPYSIQNFSKFEGETISDINYPKVLIVTLVRNKGHTLPYFLSYLENLDYPKKNISLWIRSDHNEDNTLTVLKKWLNRTKNLYYDVDYYFKEEPKFYKNETVLWPKERFEHLINLKEEALSHSRQKNWADFIFYLDADVFLTNPLTLKQLVHFNLPVVSPMLKSESQYSNFWCEMEENYYFKESFKYSVIYKGYEIDNFKVSVVLSAILINLRDPTTEWLTFSLEKLHENQIKHDHYTVKYDGPFDDVIIFAMSSKYFGIEQYISNIFEYGYIVQPLPEYQNLNYDMLLLENIKIQMIYELEESLTLNDELKEFVQYPEPNKLSFDHIYMINLNRRPERKHKMELQFREMGLIVERFEATDGREIKFDDLESMGVKILPNYEDPILRRKIKIGEIGCFLSHYKIWEKIIELGQKEVLIFEDDVRFFPFFRTKAFHLIEEARKTANWDILYLGRKPLNLENEKWANSDKTLIYPGWTYWNLGYAVTLECAKKLVAAKPLEKMLPVDEFIPIMFDQHPNNTWKTYFEDRNLVALSVYPTILEPGYFFSEEKYVSDTEDSIIIEEDDYHHNWKIYSDEL